MPTNYSLEYLAGFFDGEGCINAPNSKDLPYPAAVVSQLKDHSEVLYEFQRRWGGFVGKGNGNRRVVFVWRVTGRSCQQALEELLPYLHVKDRQATLALEIIKMIYPGRRESDGTWHRVSPHEATKRRDLAAQIRDLNQGRVA